MDQDLFVIIMAVIGLIAPLLAAHFVCYSSCFPRAAENDLP